VRAAQYNRAVMRGSRVAVDRRAPAGVRIAIVISRYHAAIAAGLETGARAALGEAGLGARAVTLFEAPGAFELSQVARRVAERGRWDAIICLGCLVRGETPHFDYIAQAAAHGITRAAQDTGVPMAFGVLTTDTAEQAAARATDGPLNKGREAAAAALAMVRLYRGSDPTAAKAPPVRRRRGGARRAAS